MTVVKHSSCALKYDVPDKVKSVIEKCELDYKFEDISIEDFEIKKLSGDKVDSEPLLLYKELECAESEDAGVYTVTLQYKRQKYIHKIAVDVGEFFH